MNTRFGQFNARRAALAGLCVLALSAAAAFVAGRVAGTPRSEPTAKAGIGEEALARLRDPDIAPVAAKTAPKRPTARPRQEPPPALNPANAGLEMRGEGFDLIRAHEGLRLEAYEAGGAWYVGYGHARTAHEGMTIAQEDAERLLREDVEDAGAAVKAVVAADLTPSEYSALVSLAYNLGGGAFARSRIVERLNAGDRHGAADAFLYYDNAGGAEHPGLAARRREERALFLEGEGQAEAAALP